MQRLQRHRLWLCATKAAGVAVAALAAAGALAAVLARSWPTGSPMAGPAAWPPRHGPWRARLLFLRHEDHQRLSFCTSLPRDTPR